VKEGWEPLIQVILPTFVTNILIVLTLSNQIFLPPAYTPALTYFGRERGWWITCNYPSFKREKQKQNEYNLRYLLPEVRTT
jgi:hypothetical protein